jgi:hypothetical protein
MPLSAKQFAAAMRAAPLKVRAAAAQVVTQTALVGEAELRQSLSGRVLQRRKGNLLRSLRSELRGSGARTVVTLILGNREAPYAAVHEFGATIRAKNGPYLHFRLPDGEWRRRKFVVIPPRPSMAPAADVARRFMLRRLPLAVADAIKVAS